jgi:heme-degrading monooxygenase HmoA
MGIKLPIVYGCQLLCLGYLRKLLIMIERHWKGTAKFEEADNYVKHLLDDTFPKLETIHGFVRATILKRVVAKGIEFLIHTEWESFESIKQFAGNEVSIAVVPDLVRKMMIEFDDHVSHYEVVTTVKSK